MTEDSCQRKDVDDMLSDEQGLGYPERILRQSIQGYS